MVVALAIAIPLPSNESLSASRCRAHPECLRELLDPADRRFGYAFTNCTLCGPRYTILLDVPYDRPNTTMRSPARGPACSAAQEDQMTPLWSASGT